MARTRGVAMTLLVVLVTTAGVATGADCTRWVATSGSDSASGTQAQPWATLQHAMDWATAGAVVCVETGAYTEAEVVVSRSGTLTGPVTLRAPT